MITFQDFDKQNDKINYSLTAITKFKGSSEYKLAVDADLYDRQMNVTINEYVKRIYSLAGSPVVDFTASNNKIASNFFHRLNTQLNTYLLGNGITFNNENIKEKLGKDFDAIIAKAGKKALEHGVTFLFWNLDRIYNFPLTEFLPLFDEETGELKAGVRFWQIDSDKPLMYTIYEIDGYTRCKSDDGKVTVLQEKTPYKTTIKITQNGEVLEETGENYPSFPIVPFYGNENKQSTLVGMQRAIDSFDLIRSGFANDLTDCAQIYWLISNCDGMTDEDLGRFRDRLLLNHIATTSDQSQTVKPYTQEIPFEARTKYLESIRSGIYEDFGAIDTYKFVGGERTATEIRASYQPLDENADDFEYQIIQAIGNLLKLQDIEMDKETTPIFKRNRIANEKEQVEMVIMEAPYLDDETILKKLPNITVDEVQAILDNKATESVGRFNQKDKTTVEE